MFTPKPLWLLLASAGLVAGCMSAPDKQALRIEPLLSIRDAVASARDQYEIGRYFQGQKRDAEARRAYEKALAIDPGLAQAANNLAVIEAGQGHYDRAILHFRLALERRPDDAALHNNLGYVYLLQGQHRAALAEFDAALRLAPGHPRAAANQLAARHFSQLAEAQATPTTSGGNALPATPPASEPPAPATAGVDDAPRPPEVAPPPAAPSPTSPSRPALAEAPSEPAIAPAPAEAPSLAVLPGALAEPPAAPTFAPAPSPEPALADAPETAPAPRRAGLEISNGNGVTGMALRLRGFLRAKGMDRARLTNERPFVRQETAIAYRSGFADAAQHLSAKLPHPVTMFESAALRPGTDVRLLLGKDIATAERTAATGTPSWLALR